MFSHATEGRLLRRAGCFEVFAPNIRAGIEQPGDLSRFGNEPGNIRSFIAIAVRTSQRQITFRSFAAMLLRAYVVDLKRNG
jgi:hypothetical protein